MYVNLARRYAIIVCGRCRYQRLPISLVFLFFVFFCLSSWGGISLCLPSFSAVSHYYTRALPSTLGPSQVFITLLQLNSSYPILLSGCHVLNKFPEALSSVEQCIFLWGVGVGVGGSGVLVFNLTWERKAKRD